MLERESHFVGNVLSAQELEECEPRPVSVSVSLLFNLLFLFPTRYLVPAAERLLGLHCSMRDVVFNSLLFYLCWFL